MTTTHELDRPPHAGTLDFLGNGRLLLAMLLGFGVLVGAAAIASRVTITGPDAGSALSGAEVTPPRALPALALVRADGSAWSSADTEGRLALYFFGYTHCPDVCPLTLSRANQIQTQLGADAAQVDVYFVTVEPARDTPERLGRYVSQFSPDFTALTGTTAQLAAAQTAFGVIAVQQPNSSGSGYTVDHTASSYLVDSDGRIRLIYPHDGPSDDVVGDIRTLLSAE